MLLIFYSLGWLKIFIKAKAVIVVFAGENACFLVFTNTLFKEVGFALNGNHVHEIEGVGGVVNALIAELNQ